MKNWAFWFGNGHVFPNFGLEMDEKLGVLVWKWSRFSRILVWKWMKNWAFWFGNGHVFPNFGLEMDEKSGALVWKWSRSSRILVWKWMKNRVLLMRQNGAPRMASASTPC
ncbi:hypothetical protein [Prevotellamassilia timonensis]|uniref:hypothetical protein n=1 Tax=Prevotellamassilia timonensis TaxID=1852370 RepID=UPI003FD85A13